MAKLGNPVTALSLQNLPCFPGRQGFSESLPDLRQKQVP